MRHLCKAVKSEVVLENFKEDNTNYEELIQRSLINGVSSDEKRALQKRIKNHIKNQSKFKLHTDIRQLVQNGCRINNNDQQTAWDNLRQRILLLNDVLQLICSYLLHRSKNVAVFISALLQGTLTFCFNDKLLVQNAEIAYTEHNVTFGSNSPLNFF